MDYYPGEATLNLCYIYDNHSYTTHDELVRMIRLTGMLYDIFTE